MIFYFFLVILIPTITITTLGNLIYKNSMINAQNANTQQMAKQISNNIDFYMKDTENIITYLSQDLRVLNFLNNNDVKQSDNSVQDDVCKAITSFTSVHPEIAGIMIVNDRDIYVSDVMYRTSRDLFTNENWYYKAYHDPKNIQLLSKPIGRNINNIFKYSADDVVSMSKAVIDNKTGNVIGVILIDMKLDIIKNVIENVKPGKNGFVYIVDSTGDIVYSPVNNVVYRIKEEWLEGYNDNVMIKRLEDNDYEIMHMDSTYTGWKTVVVAPLEESLKVVTYIKYYSLTIAVITLVFAVILAVFFTRSIVNPITKLRRLMKRTEEGKLDCYFNSKYKDEIGELGNSFNNMLREIKNLINLVQIEEKNKRKAEINTLQAQIKPHFLYNTLDTIQWMAQEHNAEDIVDMVGNLTNLLRIGLNNGNEIIKLKKEIEYVESYLIIQKTRYEDKLNYEINIDDNILEYDVIKLILQPLVENAIYHGIKEKRGKGKITITGEIEDNKIHIQIIDNGIGIKEDKLKEINKVLKEGHSSNTKIGYGIFNVNERIKLNYGEEFTLSYSSEYGQGTSVDIWHPILS
ncbi:sensor histidine kinase YpdA [Clostridium magnum DSM 2767]|uniref:histidine kinase n=1 Tax=Clostridium magnum DSM 2767 TaxID=1121326 RepID=A0A161YR20_9CLOT|nr:sensor histidine kinase YpdA [Clostridium magnum DSM 2767]SHI16278.1 two-component system, sensor histidine kinase YesM [Clostridium magnum DSM 2767]